MTRPAHAPVARSAGAALLLPVVLSLGACAPASVDPVALARAEAAAMPGSSSGAYAEPDASQRALLASMVAQASQDDPAAEESARAIGYELQTAQQAGGPGGGRRLVLLRPGPDVRARGWGWTALRPGTPVSSVVVEVPHPASDLDTELVGAEVFVRSGAAALLVAGAHRRSSPLADVADHRRSPLHVWQQALVGRGDTVLQVHGFDRGAHRSFDADVVVSDGAAAHEGRPASEASRRVADALERAGISVCLHHRDRCDALAGTQNVQGTDARAAGVEFVHLELSRPLRSDPARRAVVVAALADALRPGL